MHCLVLKFIYKHTNESPFPLRNSSFVLLPVQPPKIHILLLAKPIHIIQQISPSILPLHIFWICTKLFRRAAGKKETHPFECYRTEVAARDYDVQCSRLTIRLLQEMIVPDYGRKLNLHIIIIAALLQGWLWLAPLAME